MLNKSAFRVLETCERGLRDLLAKAAAKGDYSEVIQLTSWAKVIRSLADDAQSDHALVAVSPPVKPTPSGISGATDLRRSIRAAPQRGKSNKPEVYPKFFRRGDELVKLGWSKRDREEYQHKAPYKVLNLLVRKLATVGAGGRMFAADDVLPLTTDHGGDVPNYQGYLCLAWLRSEGLIESHGRQGYTISNTESLSKGVEDRWQALVA
jgi:hypothetical protein